MRIRVSLVVLGVVFATSGLLRAAEVPAAVSPGMAEGVSRVDSACPTFNWAGVAGAGTYELVVYRVGEDGEEAKPALRQRVPGTANGWTPSLDRCLEHGGQYAWSVRAESRGVDGPWSETHLFRVAASPSVAEVREAMEVLQEFLRTRPAATNHATLPPLLPPNSAPPALAPAAGAITYSPGTRAPSIFSFDSVGARFDDESGPAKDAVAVHGTVQIGGTTAIKAGVIGEVTTSGYNSGNTFGVYGLTGSKNGVGVRGDAYADTGFATGIVGVSNSLDGFGGRFENISGGVSLNVNWVLALVPTDSAPACTEGFIYFDDSENWLCICNGVSFRRADNGALCT